MQVRNFDINIKTATREELLAAGFALDVLKCKRPTRNQVFYTKADCKTRRVRK